MIDVVLERLQWTIVSALESTPHMYTAVLCLTLPDFEEFFFKLYPDWNFCTI